MRPIYRFSFAALTALAGMASSARAQVVVNAPFVSVGVGGGGVFVRAPFVRVQTRPVVVAPAPGPTLVPQPERIGDPVPVPLPAPGQSDFSVPVPLPGQRMITHREFAETFKPAPGTYDVVILHPVTHKPVQVTFTLPPGAARNVRSFPRQINFDYGGRRDVTIRFLGDGRVRVTN